MKISILPTVLIGLMKKKVRLPLRKQGAVEHKFVDYILPKKCLNLTISDDYSGFASVVDKNCDDLKLGELSADNFKCLIFAQGLVSAKDAEIRRRVLSK